MLKTVLCPCHSQKPYSACCQPYHEGRLPDNAQALMRSRYSAYALHLADYIIQTTDTSNPSYNKDFAVWKEEILQFCRETEFVGLEISEFKGGPERATVTFIAHLKQGGQPVSFTEKSAFVKEGGCWLYCQGTIS